MVANLGWKATGNSRKGLIRGAGLCFLNLANVPLVTAAAALPTPAPTVGVPFLQRRLS